MTYLFAVLKVGRALTEGPAIGNLPPAITPTGITLSLFLVATQVCPKTATLRIVSINVLVQRLMAYGQFACNLLRTRLLLQQRIGLRPNSRCYGAKVLALRLA